MPSNNSNTYFKFAKYHKQKEEINKQTNKHIDIRRTLTHRRRKSGNDFKNYKTHSFYHFYKLKQSANAARTNIREQQRIGSESASNNTRERLLFRIRANLTLDLFLSVCISFKLSLALMRFILIVSDVTTIIPMLISYYSFVNLFCFRSFRFSFVSSWFQF